MFFLAFPKRCVAFYQNDNALQRRKWPDLGGIIGHSLQTEKISKEPKYYCGPPASHGAELWKSGS